LATEADSCGLANGL